MAHAFAGFWSCECVGLFYFVSPQAGGVPTAVPYATFGNPQSLNLYSYVRNNPVTTRDPDGHCGEVATCTLEFAALGTEAAGPIGTAIGAAVGAVTGAAIVYYGGKVISNEGGAGLLIQEPSGYYGG